MTIVSARVSKESQPHKNEVGYHTKNQLRIWFTKANSSEPLGSLENELRLIQARSRHPDHQIRLIYASSTLTTAGLEKLTRFCQKHQIEAVSLDKITDKLQEMRANGLIGERSFNVQNQLLEVAMSEINSKKGNLAAASDIVRLLTPCLLVDGTQQSRMYIDLDEALSSSLPEVIMMQPGQLLRTEDNNNFLFATEPESEVIQVLREKIFANYQTQAVPDMLWGASNQALSTAFKHHAHTRFILDIVMGDRSGSDDEKILKQNLINSLSQKSGINWKAETDIYAIREMLDRIKQTTNEEKNIKFLSDFYMHLVISMSGPGIYHQDNLLNTTKELPVLEGYQLRSDLSWVPNSRYHARVEKKQVAAELLASSMGKLFRSKPDKLSLKELPENQEHADVKKPSGKH